MGLAEAYGTALTQGVGCAAGLITAVAGVGVPIAILGCSGAVAAQVDFVDQLGCFREAVISSTVQGRDTPVACRFSTPFKEAINGYFGVPVFTTTEPTPAAATPTPASQVINIAAITPAVRQQVISEVDANIQMLTARFADNAAIYSQWLEEQQNSLALAKYGSIALSVLAVASVSTAIYLGTRSGSNSGGKNV